MAVVIAALAGLFTTTGSSAVASNGRLYLALGDSVAFGYITQAGFEYGNPHNFVPYSDYTGTGIRMNVTNAACPGETTSHFLSTSGADNGCGAFRAVAPLHTTYKGTQMDFATSFLSAHRSTLLVTVGLGANNLFLLQNACAGVVSCVQAGLPATLNTVGTEMDTILGNLRATGYHGVIEVVNYYSLDYSDAVTTAITEELNAAETASAASHQAVVADVFSAFSTAAAAAGGKTCQAGLLNASPANQFICDVHPSQSGQQLMAQTVVSTFLAAGGGG